MAQTDSANRAWLAAHVARWGWPAAWPQGTMRFDHDTVSEAFGLVRGSHRGSRSTRYEGGDRGSVLMSALDPTFKRLARRARAGDRGHPIATVAFYGPTNEFASKVVLGLSEGRDSEPVILGRWLSDGPDIRSVDAVGNSILELVRQHGARTVAMTRGVIGCPHEEGIDYPEGEACPRCPFWAGRDRWREL